MDEQQVFEPTRRRLGRGLSALLGNGGIDDGNAPQASNDHSDISLELIDRNPYQPRKVFEEEALVELVNSIRQHGVLQPLIVRQVGDMYQLIAGERRLMAARRVGLSQIPCRVLELTDQQVHEVSLEENLKRQDLNVLEKAQAFQSYLQQFGCSLEDLAHRISMDRSTVANLIRLLELPPSIQDDVRAGRISGGHARSMLSLAGEDQLLLAQRIQQEGLSVRKTEEAVRELQAKSAAFDVEPGATVPFKQPKAGRPQPTAHVISLQEQLRDMLGAKVEIKLKKKEQGQIIIDFMSNDDFERILGQLRRVA